MAVLDRLAAATGVLLNPPSERSAIASFIVMDVMRAAAAAEAAGRNIIHMEVGEPDFDVPACVKEATCQAVNEGHTHYTHSLGVGAGD